MNKINLITVTAAMIIAAGCDPEAHVGELTSALDASTWSCSEWLSVKEAPTVDRKIGGNERAADGTSWFATTVKNSKPVAKATWMTTALGVYEVYVNGKAVGNEFLKPGFTHVRKTRRSFTYDVTEAFDTAEGAENVFAAEVSAGWWRDKIVTPVNSTGFSGRKSAFRGVLKLEYADGSVGYFGTDTKNWKCGIAGGVIHAAIFDGEDYDARIPQPTKGEGLTSVPEVNREFNGVILPDNGAEVYLRKDLAMVKGPYSLKKGEKLVIDFGQNCAGVPAFRFSAKRGTLLTCLPAEMINDADEGVRGCDGPKGTIYRRNLRCPKFGMWVKYIFAGEGVETYWPRFTFFGYRYVELSATDDVEIESVASLPVSSVTKAMEIGSFECGDKDLNRFVKNVYWGMLSNYLSVPTDCPQRNERLGWTADTQVFADAGAYIADTRRFFDKWMHDERDTQDPRGGLPGVAPWAQYGAETNAMMRIGWADAGVVVPWKIWRQFGYTRIVDENWAMMEKFVDHVNATRYEHKAIEAECGDYQWNDWLSLDRYESASSGRNPEFDAFERDPVTKKRIVRKNVRTYWDFLGACHWVMDAQMMCDMARATGRNVTKWQKMETTAKAYMKERFFNTPDGMVIDIFAAMQTPAVFALKLGLVEGAAKEKTRAFLKQDLIKRGNVTGFLGSAWLMEVLVDNGMADIAMNRLLSHEFPSWLYSVDQGATTIWERWNGWTKDRGFGPAGMNSYNHYAYGAVLAWMYRHLAGIAPDVASPGFKTIVMKPIFDRRLGYVKASYSSANGVIVSEWKYEGDKVVWNFTIPEGTTALVQLPGETTIKPYLAGSYTIEK